MTEKLILEKLSNLEIHASKMDEQMAEIRKAINLIAVQGERINHVTEDVISLKDQYESAFAPDGIVNQVKNWQSSCPRESIKDALSRQWVVIAFLATLVIGTTLGNLYTLAKIFGRMGP